uniref:UPAR/Ly6 domain-containing protein n=1 Tax=Panagrellus redivivus TaxID=6233 RepID=A0A7E4UZ93_PANRE
MNAAFLSVVIVMVLVGESFGLKCFTCDNTSCATTPGYVQEDCPPASKCYFKKNAANQVFQAGCFTNQCSLKDRNCFVCGSELCNAPNAPQLKEPKIGEGAKPSGAASTPELIFAFALGICALYVA